MANPFDQFDEPSMQGNPFDQFDEVEKPKAGFGVAFKKALAGAGNAMESAISLPAGALASYAGFQEQGDEIFRTMDANRTARNKWANPDNLETTTGQDIAGMAATFPVQIPAMLGQAAEKGIDLIQRGEPLSTAIPATLADAGMNAAGVGPMQAAKTFLGRAAIGAGGNIALGAGSDAATQLLATQDSTKAAYDPYDPRRRFQDALVGGITQGLMGERPTAPKTPSRALNANAALDAAAEAKKAPAPAGLAAMDELKQAFSSFDRDVRRQKMADRPQQGTAVLPVDAEGNVGPKDLGTQLAMEQQRQALQAKWDAEVAANEAAAQYKPNDALDGQRNLFEPAVEGRGLSPYEATTGDWRVDENGMPVRVDLSMELQNLQNPLQRNLWGDELDVGFPRDPNATLGMDRDIFGYERMSETPVRDTDLEMTSKPLTQAIDEMPDLPWRGDRDVGIDLLKHELPASPDLEVARMDAELRQWLDANDQPKNAMAARFSKTGRAKKQGGGLLIGDKKVTVEATEDGFIARIGDKEVGRLRSNITPEQRAQLGETANVDIIKVDDAVKGKGVGAALYDAWTKANNGEVAPSGKTSLDAWKVWKRDNPAAVDKFVNQEAQRIRGGADPQMVLGNISDPEIAQRVQEGTTPIPKQVPGLRIETETKPWGEVTVRALLDGEEVGVLDGVDASGQQHPFVEVSENYRRKGIATAMYNAAKEAGAVIPPENSPTALRTPDGAGFRKAMKSQLGGVLFDWKKQPELDQIQKVGALRESLKNFIPSDMTPDAVVDVAKGMKDVDQNVAQRAINTFTKGGLYQAEKTNNPIIKFTVDKVLNADRLARADVRDYIHDSLAPAMRDLSKAEMTEIATVLNHADKVQVPVTPEFLRQQGFSEKQVSFAEAHRQTMDASFDAINRAREAAGMEPISKRVAYSAMNFTGDYRKLVYTLDEEGNKTVVGAIGAKTAWGLKGIEKQLKKANPEYVIEAKPRYMGGNAGEKGGSAVLAVQQALSLLAENDPNTKAFLDVMEQIKTAEAYDYLNTKSHTKAKKGVFGAEGRKPWESAEQNAKDFMDAQLQYAEAALKWGHLSDAANEVKKVLSSDVDMPNAKQWSEGYLQNALGINPSATGRAFEKAVNQFWESSGIGRTIPAKAQMYSRKAVNTMLLGLNPGFLAANLVQPMLSLPAMTTFLKGRGIDAMTTGYDSTFKAGLTLFKERMGKLSDLEQAAVKYAEDNHVFGSDLVDTSNISRKNAEFYLDKTGNFLASNVESGTRKLVYYSFVHMLNDNGLGRDFGLAQNLTDIAMNNYSPVERPQVFNALGPVGDLAANLSSFKHNELSRLAMFAREIGKDANAAPFLMQIATQVAAAGMTGTIAFSEADWLYRQITKALGAPDSLSRVVIDFSEGLTENAKGKYLASHGVFSALGIDMSKRLGISDVIPDSLPEAMFPGGSKLVDVGAAGLSAIGDPSELNLKRFAREAAPGVATGPMDRAWFSKDTPQGELAVNRRTLEGQVIRTEADKMAKNIGFTGINESVQKQKLYDLKQQGIGYQELRNAVFKKMTNQMYTTGKIDPKLIENYAKYEGDLGTLETSLEAYAKKSNASMVDLAKLRAVAARSLPQQKQGQRVMEAFDE